MMDQSIDKKVDNLKENKKDKYTDLISIMMKDMDEDSKKRIYRLTKYIYDKKIK